MKRPPARSKSPAPKARPVKQPTPLTPVTNIKAKRVKTQKPLKQKKQASLPKVAKLRHKRSLSRIALIATSISLVLLLGVVLVSAFSPLLAIQRIDIKGNHRIPIKLLKNALSDQIDRPLPQVSLSDIQDDLKNFSLIQSVSVVNLPPHTLQVRIVEREPICIVKTGLGMFLYDPAGVRIGSVDSTTNYPVVIAPGKAGASPEFKSAINALLALPMSLYPRVASVSAPSMDSVTFELRGESAQKVIWGDSTQAGLKAKALLAMIKHQKKSDRVTYDVSSPKAPTVRFR